MIWTVIYLIGYIAAFIALILLFREDEDVTLNQILLILFLSITSWIGFLVISIFYPLVKEGNRIIIKQRKK